MSASNPTAIPGIEATLEADVRVDCYVRSSVPAAVSERITALLERLRTLEEAGILAEVQVTQWPAEHVLGDTDQPTRDDLVAEFDEWASQRGYSLEPGFCWQQTAPSPLGVDEPRESLRVPLVTLALYDATDDAAEHVRGVVPCTSAEQATAGRTYTVDEWLTAVETHVALPESGTEQQAML